MKPHIARKRFGQHFLSDALTIDAIVGAIAPQAGQSMVEIIGLPPGTRAITGSVGTLLAGTPVSVKQAGK